jgi:DNA-binding PadR family transcriptional regulator
LRTEIDLTDDEATALSLLERIQPATAYQILKIYEASPVSNYGTSKGKIYPLIRRLKSHGLLQSQPVAGDARGTEWLTCTPRGLQALRRWVKSIRPGHLLLEDPIRTMLQSIDVLRDNEKLEWVDSLQESLRAKLSQLEAYKEQVFVPYQDLLHENAVRSLRVRIDWLDEVRHALAKRGVSPPRAQPRPKQNRK